MLSFLLQTLTFFLASRIVVCQNTSSSLGAPSPSSNPNSTLSLQVTALVGQSNQTVFQCWKIQPDFQAGTGGAKIQQLGDILDAVLVTFSLTNVTYVGVRPVLTPQYVLQRVIFVVSF